MLPTEDLQLIIMASQMCVIENEMEEQKDKLRQLLGEGFDRDSPEINAVKRELVALFDKYRSQEAEYLRLRDSLKR